MKNIVVPALSWKAWLGIGVGLAVAIGLLLWQVRAAGYEAGHASRDKEVADLEMDLAACKTNEIALGEAIKRQNESIQHLYERGLLSQKAADEALMRRREAERLTAALRSRLEREARSERPGTPVALTPSQQEAWEMLR